MCGQQKCVSYRFSNSFVQQEPILIKQVLINNLIIFIYQQKSMKKIQSVFVSCIYAEQYRFTLKKAGTQTTLLDVDFAPIFKKQTKQFVSSYPSILHDKRSHMPFFFVPGHQTKPNENLYLQVHSTKIMESLQQKQQIYIPKPSIKNSCCIVCRSSFEDYLTHIQTSQHMQAVNSSQFNQEIKQLCQNFSRKRQYRNRQPSKQKTPSKPVKKRKIQQLPTLQLKDKSSSIVTADSWTEITKIQN